jgi:hypothetical protein
MNVDFKRALEDLVCQLPEDSDIAPKHVGGFIKTVRFYMLCVHLLV